MEKRQHPALTLLNDIRFWIGLFTLVHLFFITLPPLEPASTWRQTDGLMIARNFYERNGNILYPTTDVCGDKTGITGCEFPLINYSIALMSHVFGYHDWFGRLLNVILSAIGVFFFYRTLREQFNRQVAFNASLIMLASIWFTYSRTNIPDTYAVSLCMIAIFFAIRFLRDGGAVPFILFLLPAMAGCLIRISSASLLTVLVIPFLYSGNRSRRVVFTAGSILVLVAVYAWYFVWVPYLNNTYGISGQFFMGMSFSDGLATLMSDIPLTLKRLYETPLKFSGFIVFLGGLIYAVMRRERKLLAVFSIPFVVYLIMVVKLAVGWHIDAYYVMMIVPGMALVAGWALTQIRKKSVAIALLAFIVIEGVANQFHVLSIRQPNLQLVQLEQVMDTVSRRDDLIACNGIHASDPTPMYMAHRRGWVLATTDFTDPGVIANLRAGGCKYILIVRKAIEDIALDLPVAFQSDDFAVYQLN